MPVSVSSDVVGSLAAGSKDPCRPVTPRRLARVELQAIPLRTLVPVILVLLVITLIGAATLTWVQLDRRKHDYAILHLAGQLRVAADGLHHQSQAALRESGGGRLPDWYADELRRTALLYDRIIEAFAARDLPRDLTGRDDELICKWDEASRRQLERSVAAWREVRGRIAAALRPDADADSVLAAAQVLDAQGGRIAASTLELSRAFKAMMEGHLGTVTRVQYGIAAVALLLAAAVLWLARTRVLRPLATAEAGIARIAQGEFGHQVDAGIDDEIGRIARAVNGLSARMHRLFQLTHRIGEGTTVPDAIDFVREEFGRLLPVDWVGLVQRPIAHDGRWQLIASSGTRVAGIADAHWVQLKPELEVALPSARVHTDALDRSTDGTLDAHLAAAGHQSLLIVRLRADADGDTLLLFAARHPLAFRSEDVELLANIGTQLRGLLDRVSLTESLVVAAVEGLAKLAESRDPETGDHLARMSLYAKLIAEEMGRQGREAGRLGPREAEEIRRFAPMHDIGKVGVEDAILLKPGRFDEHERRQMQRHPVIGGEVLRRCEAQMNRLGRSVFRCGIEIAECHHERWDGTGYPLGLAAEAIPLAARIVAVADVFDALTSRRPYKEAWTVERALATIREDVGRHFDPEAVAALERAMPRVMAVYDRLKHV